MACDPVADFPPCRCTSIVGIFAFSANRKPYLPLSLRQKTRGLEVTAGKLGGMEIKGTIRGKNNKNCIKIKYKAPFLNKDV